MANEVKTVLIGISDIGHVVDPYGDASGPTEVSWGATEENGATFSINGQTVDIRSGQSKFLEEQFMNAVDANVAVRLQYADLLNWARALGLADDDSGFTGDLQADPATDEELEPLIAALGQTERYMYIRTPGPSGARTFYVKRGRITPNLSVDLASNAHQGLEFTIGILRPKRSGHENTPILIVDEA